MMLIRIRMIQVRKMIHFYMDLDHVSLHGKDARICIIQYD